MELGNEDRLDICLVLLSMVLLKGFCMPNDRGNAFLQTARGAAWDAMRKAVRDTMEDNIVSVDTWLVWLLRVGGDVLEEELFEVQVYFKPTRAPLAIVDKCSRMLFTRCSRI